MGGLFFQAIVRNEMLKCILNVSIRHCFFIDTKKFGRPTHHFGHLHRVFRDKDSPDINIDITLDSQIQIGIFVAFVYELFDRRRVESLQAAFYIRLQLREFFTGFRARIFIIAKQSKLISYEGFDFHLHGEIFFAPIQARAPRLLRILHGLVFYHLEVLARQSECDKARISSLL